MRLALQSGQTIENPLLLITIEHEDLPEPIRLSSDNTVRLSDEPLLYGTKSRLSGSTSGAGNLVIPADFLFVLMSFALPDDQEEGTTSTDLVLARVDDEMVDVVRSFSTPATVHFHVVLAGDPDYVDFEWTDLRTISTGWNDASITLTISREDDLGYGWPNLLMDKKNAPGLYR
jgi:hypothetical protein